MYFMVVEKIGLGNPRPVIDRHAGTPLLMEQFLGDIAGLNPITALTTEEGL